MTSETSSQRELRTLRGASALTVQATIGITDLVEELHSTIAGLALPIRTAAAGPGAKPRRARGISGLVYQSVRGITGVVGRGIELALAAAEQPAVARALAPALQKLGAQLDARLSHADREAVRAAANGVLGDTLAATHNPLAIEMQLHKPGSTPPSGRVLVMIHGLCMNHLQWQREGHDHGAWLAAELGFTPIYLHYNSGCSITHNGAQLSALLEQTCRSWPVPIEKIAILGHSMGGLVARSACHHALLATPTHSWVKQLSKLITLGSPHAGAPLERAGRGLDFLLGVSPYSAPFARLGLVRSAGIQDLRHGAVAEPGEPRWPKWVKLYTLAATKQKATPSAKSRSLTEPLLRLLGDGLVPVNSALAKAEKPSLGLPLQIPASRQAIVYETDHFALLSSMEVAQQLRKWLKTAGAEK